MNSVQSPVYQAGMDARFATAARHSRLVRILRVAVPAAVIWNALLAYPVFALVRKLVGSTERVERAREVELLV